MTQTRSDMKSHGSLKTRIAVAFLVAGGLAPSFGVTGASAALHSHATSSVISTSRAPNWAPSWLTARRFTP